MTEYAGLEIGPMGGSARTSGDVPRLRPGEQGAAALALPATHRGRSGSECRDC
jgi:hypothetical protein